MSPAINVRVLSRDELPAEFSAPIGEVRPGALVSVAIRLDLLVSAIVESVGDGRVQVVTDLYPIANPGSVCKLELTLSPSQLVTATHPDELH